ncbi:MAG: hypothetical protein ABSA86_13910 [Oryzomonas sp.]
MKKTIITFATVISAFSFSAIVYAADQVAPNAAKIAQLMVLQENYPAPAPDPAPLPGPTPGPLSAPESCTGPRSCTPVIFHPGFPD